jgi:hypothetical protein
MNGDSLDPAISSCGGFQARLIGPLSKVTDAIALFERLKKDAAFAPRQRPSSWRVSSNIKAQRDLKNLFWFSAPGELW